MYTTWRQRYRDLEAFTKAVREAKGGKAEGLQNVPKSPSENPQSTSLRGSDTEFKNESSF